MTQIIRSKWADLIELVEARRVYTYAPPNEYAKHHSECGIDVDDALDCLKSQNDAPHFVISDELVEMTSQEEHIRSLGDLERAGLLRLPYPVCVVELNAFVAMSPEAKAKCRGTVQRAFALLYEPKAGDVTSGNHVAGMPFSVTEDEDGLYALVPTTSHAIKLVNREDDPLLRFEAFDVAWFQPKPNDPVDAAARVKLSKKLHDKEMAIVCKAWAALCLTLRTRGVGRETIEPKKLNKARAAKGRPSIPRHTYIHVERVYNRDGSTTEHDERRSPRPHWRRGHIRNVRYGRGREKTRPVFIEPMLVSWNPEADQPEHPDYKVEQ